MRERTGATRDEDGATAAARPRRRRGDCQAADAPVLRAAPVRNRSTATIFARGSATHAGLAEKSTEDGAATLTVLTAASVARVVESLPRAPQSWIVAGGGARNPTLMRMLAEKLAPATVETADQVGWSVDALEAQAFAFLAVRSLKGLPLTFPTTTGAPRPMTGGVLAKP